MATALNITSIPAPRVALIDERTGTISREWYRFLLNLFTLTGSGSNPTSLEDVQLGPPTQNIDIGSLDPTPSGFAAYAAGSTQESQIAEIQKQLDALQLAPQFDIAAFVTTLTAPVTETADFLVNSSDWYINNKSGSTCVTTLPTASLYIGRQITFKNMQAQSLNSASSNVVPIDSVTAGTAILLPVIGNWATMVSDGTNWVIMQQAPNNILLLE